ncbi:2OG-Fe(II) oxygenase [Ideonella livida]|uniref:2-oxoglutarate-dependent dioxygenase n=1 Tax=Ideonella livida TaxID=2707176 RepID=A0A7C9TJD8_9BURK|nr:2OG-Fe(II) oxygenase [Ideonella livida]NDY90545.1 2-oxoglutarate-dependent dioxygenase [Ideonella livida]
MQAEQPITQELKRWIVAQAQAGCRPEDVLEAMKSSGWRDEVAIRAMEEALQSHLQSQGPLPGSGMAAFDPRTTAPSPAQAAGLTPREGPARAAPAGLLAAAGQPGPDLASGRSTLIAGDREVTVLMQSQRPRAVLFGNFLSSGECEALVAMARGRLARSETVVNETGGSEVNSARTSDGMFFNRGENELCARIEKRIADLLRWPIQNGEGLQVLRYLPGARYLAHQDYFDPEQPGAGTILARGGQRVGTLVMYLNTPLRGGATTFPDAGLEVSPVRGNALFFAYDRPDPACLALHSGAPVEEGEKWVATKWLRQGVFS